MYVRLHRTGRIRMLTMKCIARDKDKNKISKQLSAIYQKSICVIMRLHMHSIRRWIGPGYRQRQSSWHKEVRGGKSKLPPRAKLPDPACGLS